jgi:hypothetical protein
VLLVTQVVGGDDPAPQPNTVQNPPGSGAQAPGAPVSRGETTVAVLNGTTVPGLAAQIADQLERGGFRRGQVTNAADQQRAETTVAYASGSRRGAQEVARILEVPRVTAADANTQAIAGPDAEVIVTVGSDRTQ